MKKNYSVLKYVVICVLVLAAGTIGYLLPTRARVTPLPDNTTNVTKGLNKSIDKPVDYKIVVEPSRWWCFKNMAIEGITVALEECNLYCLHIGVFYWLINKGKVGWLINKGKVGWLINAKLLSCILCLFNFKDRLKKLYLKLKKTNTLLLQSALQGNLDVVKYLVEEAGADINITDQKGKTALQWARKEGHLAIVEYLKEKDPTQYVFLGLFSELGFWLYFTFLSLTLIIRGLDQIIKLPQN